MNALPPLAQDLAQRRPVWQAWSGLYLDTELSPAMTEAACRALAEAPYSAAQLSAILWSEVHPACFPNMLTVAGEWAFFDTDWLTERILRRHRAIARWPTTLIPGRNMVRHKAKTMLHRVRDLRAAPA